MQRGTVGLLHYAVLCGWALGIGSLDRCVTLGRVSHPHPQFFTYACCLHCILFSGGFHFIAFLLAFLAQPELNLN